MSGKLADRFIVKCKCENCKNSGICKYEAEFKEFYNPEYIKELENDMRDMPIVTTVTCTRFDNINSKVL